jgi:hypothetical protein
MRDLAEIVSKLAKTFAGAAMCISGRPGSGIDIARAISPVRQGFARGAGIDEGRGAPLTANDCE